MKISKKLIISLSILSLSIAGLIIFSSLYFHNKTKFNFLHNANPMDENFYDTAFKFNKKQINLANYNVIAGIIPHHLLAADLIAEFFSNLYTKQDKYETVVLLGPNHFNEGNADIITSGYDWHTPCGILNSDTDIFRQIIQLGGKADKDTINKEHSINSEVSFIKKVFPRAEFLPIILKSTTTKAEVDALAEKLYSVSQNKNILVLASVDFSHYKDSLTAQEYDQTSISAIKNFDFEKLNGLDIDSWQSIGVLLKFSELSGASFKLLNNSNSAILSGKSDLQQTTSYVTGYFIKNNNFNNKQTDDIFKLLFFGDIMLDRHVREKINKDGFNYLLENFQMPEEWQKTDIQMANLEGAVTASGAHYKPEMSIDFAFDPKDVMQLKNYNFNFFDISNNHITDQGLQGFDETRNNLDELGFNYVGCADRKVDECSVKIINLQNKKVAMLAYSMVYGSLDEEKILTQIKAVREKADLVIVNMHWGVEYESQARSNIKSLAHNIVDAGADIIIGHHPHVVQEVEFYQGKPIFYSLGNFIFDQYFSRETQEGVAVGLTWQNDKIKIDLFPYYSEYSQVQLMTSEKKQKFLEWLTDISDISEEYKEQIREGKIIIH